MILTKLYDPTKGTMQVAGFMSGSGSNLRKIIEHENELNKNSKSPYHIAVIFSDNPDSNAAKIGRDYDRPVIIRDLRSFCAARGKSRKDLDTRVEYDEETIKALTPYNIQSVAYAGYMCIVTAPLIKAFLGVNVHPADLSIMREGKRVYVGDKAVKDAIMAGENELRSTTHIIEREVDQGKILMISKPIKVSLPDTANFRDNNAFAKEHQERLKVVGDLEIFPLTLQYIAEGRFAKDETGLIYFDNKSIPDGIRLN